MKTNGGVYIHIPYCVSKCGYCDFYSVSSRDGRREYPGFLIEEIKLRAEKFKDEIAFDTIFFGGGTPSLLHSKEINAILTALADNFEITKNPETTIECNPGAVDEGKLLGFFKAGVNRLSFGVQSFLGRDLSALGRIHTPSQAIDSVKMARKVGFSNIGIDLMFALPGQSIKAFEENLERAIELEPQHISCYSLTVEPGTPMAAEANANPELIADDHIQAEQYSHAVNLLAKEGFRRYEVSNFAKPGYECRHNFNYWRRQQYLGFGPSAHSFINNIRSWNIADLGEYKTRILHNDSVEEGKETLTREQAMAEYVFLGLRSEGITFNNFEEEFGIKFMALYETKIASLIENRLAVATKEKLFLTDKGFLVCDEIATALDSETKKLDKP